MKYQGEPKPIEYDPLTRAALEAQPELGPVHFQVSSGSHAKTNLLLNQHTSAEPVRYETLLPSELWGCARVLSQYFGRLNEIAVSKTTWELSGKAYPEEELTASSRLLRTEKRKGLSFALVETTTSTVSGTPLLKQLDELLLYHQAQEGWRYQEREVPDLEPFETSIPRTVYFRHSWNPEIWKNNIHTDEYARKWGYHQALPEFIMYLDWIFDAVYRQEQEKAFASQLDLPLILPVYEGDSITVRLQRLEQGFVVRLVKGEVTRLRGKVRLL